jgi:hypothetical protein
VRHLPTVGCVNAASGIGVRGRLGRYVRQEATLLERVCSAVPDCCRFHVVSSCLRICTVHCETRELRVRFGKQMSERRTTDRASCQGHGTESGGTGC